MHESYFTIGYLISGLKTYHANYCAFIPPEKGIKIHLTLLNPSQLYNGHLFSIWSARIDLVVEHIRSVLGAGV